MTFWPKEVVPTEELVKQIGADKVRQLTSELDKKTNEIRQLKARQEDLIRSHAEVLTAAWIEPVGIKTERVFVDDPVCGHISIDSELTSLLAHPLLQRLNHIKQLSFAYLKFPSATHTRLSHSLGVCKHAESALTTIFRNGVLYTDLGTTPIVIGAEQRRHLFLKAKAAGLLHDVGHGPFGHALDRFVGFVDAKKPMIHPDKFYSREYIAKYLAGRLPPDIAAENLIAILGKGRVNLEQWDSLLADVVDSSLDVDRMDYLTRDAHMTGLCMGVTDVQAIIEKMCPFREGNQIVLTYDSSCLPYVEHFLSARELMFVNCYDHPKKVSADRIFTRLVRNLILEQSLSIGSVMMLADEQILALLALAAVGSDVNSNLLAALLQNLDYELIHEVGVDSQIPSVVGWKDAAGKEMGKLAYVDLPDAWEKTIAEQAGLGQDESWRILAIVPAQELSRPVESATRILFRDGNSFRASALFEVLPKLKEHLQRLNMDRQKIRVLADARLSAEEKQNVRTAARTLLGG